MRLERRHSFWSINQSDCWMLWPCRPLSTVVETTCNQLLLVDWCCYVYAHQYLFTKHSFLNPVYQKNPLPLPLGDNLHTPIHSPQMYMFPSPPVTMNPVSGLTHTLYAAFLCAWNDSWRDVGERTCTCGHRQHFDVAHCCIEPTACVGMVRIMPSHGMSMWHVQNQGRRGWHRCVYHTWHTNMY